MITGTQAQKTGSTIVVYGPSGTGKTVFAAQAPNNFYISVEGGEKSMLEPKPKIVIPESFQDFMELMTCFTGNLNQEKKTVSFQGEDWPCTTVTVDTIDEAQRMFMAGALKNAKKETPKWDEWNLAIERTRATIRFFRNLKFKGINVIFCVHEEYEKSDLTSIVIGQPNLNGSLPTELASMVDTVLHMEVKATAKGDVTSLCTQIDGIFIGKDRSWQLPKYITAPRDKPRELFEQVWSKIT